MTKQHKATPEQWAQIERTAEDIRGDGCSALLALLELRARVEALEATQHAHVDTSRLSETVRERIGQELSWPAAWQPLKIATETTYGTAPIVVPSPAGSVVERVMDELGHYGDGAARAAILEVAVAALQMHPDKNLTWERVALWLQQEANR
jgi:hypothetical protein